MSRPTHPLTNKPQATNSETLSTYEMELERKCGARQILTLHETANGENRCTRV